MLNSAQTPGTGTQKDHMIHLTFSILSSTSILIIFKTLGTFKIKVFPVIIINYAMAFTLGLILSGERYSFSGFRFSQFPWIYFSMLIGVGLIAMFFIIALSTQKAGVSATTISSKISVIIPMLFSIFYFNETLNPVKAIGMVLALCALFCIVQKKQAAGFDKSYIHLPMILFIGMGLLDALVKFVQQEYLSNGETAGFTGASFFFAFTSGILICLFRRVPVRQFFNKKVFVAGIILGTCNFGSMFFLINALNSNIFASSILFGINSIAIVSLSIFAALVFFKEKLSPINWTGVVLSIASILLFINA